MFSPKASALDWNSPFTWDPLAHTLCGAVVVDPAGRKRCQTCELLIAFAIANGWARGMQGAGEFEIGFDLFKPMTPARVREHMEEIAA